MKTKKWTRAWLVIGVLVLAVLRAEAQTVVAWNLEWYPGRKRVNPTAAAEQVQIAACREALQKLNPDIFIAEEMRDWQAFADLVSVVPGLHPQVVSAFRDPETGELTRQQVGIASKLKAVAAWSEPWKPVLPKLPRGYSFAALESPDGGGLLMVYGLHLKSNVAKTDEDKKYDAQLRDAAVKQLLAHMEAMQTVFKAHKIEGWISAGDYNTNQDGQFQDTVVATMVGAGFWNSWKETLRQDRLTWRGNPSFHNDPTTFDYIFTKGLGEPKATMPSEPKETSDHLPVMVHLKP